MFFFCARSPSSIRPIAAKLCHAIESMLYFIIWVPKYTLPQKQWAPKTCKIRRHFGELQTLTANIYRMSRDIENRKSKKSSTTPLTLYEKICELWSTNQQVIGAHVDPPKINTARAVQADGIAIGPRDVATSRTSTT